MACEDAGIRQIMYRTENAGGAMADGFARIANQTAVVIVQNGPAATLLVPPMAEALKASIPILALVQDVPAADRDRNAFQELDHFGLFAAVSKWTRRLEHPSRVDDYVDAALTAATSGRPGPVALLLPSDVLEAPARPPDFERSVSLGRFPLDRPRPESASVREAAKIIADADDPIVIAGGGVHVSGAAPELAELQQVAHIPVATTHMGKGAVSETAPLSLGVAANVTGEHGPAHFHLPLIAKADVVILVGTRTNENGTDGWSLTPPTARYVHLDIDAGEVGRNYEALRLIGDAKAGLTDLIAELRTRDLQKRFTKYPDLCRVIAEGRERRSHAISDVTTSTQTPILPQRVLAEVDKLLTPGDIVVADASYSSIWVTGYLTAKREGQRFLVPRGQAGLGWGLPLAIGAKLANPAARVIVIAGDGGFGHVWSELETVVRERIPITVIVLNNGLLGMQRHGEIAAWGRTTSAIRFAEVDHAAIARAACASGTRVTDAENLEAVLKRALVATTPTLIDVLVDPDAVAPVRAWDTNAEAHHRLTS
jgi:acetolactate synthase-1/2/3 large subunit